MQCVGLACDQNTFDDMALALHGSPGVYYISILIFDHKFGSADLLVSSDVRLTDMHLSSIILHHYGLYFSVLIYNKDNVACDHIAVRCLFLMQGVGLACDQLALDDVCLALY